MQSVRRPPSAVILGDKHRTGVLVCQAESCRGVIGAGDFALEVATGKPFHYKCFVSAGAGDEKYAELTTRYTESSRWRGRYCSELAREAHQEQCIQHARQHWRMLWHNTPSELQVRFSPWSRPYHGSLCDAYSLRWTASAAEKLVWPDSQSLNRSKGAALVLHLFPVEWFTEGCAHWWVTLENPGPSADRARVKIAEELQIAIDSHRELTKHLRCEVSCWSAMETGATLIMRVRWVAVHGSRLQYEPAHVLSEDTLWKQAQAWQKQWQKYTVQPLIHAVTHALEDISAAYSAEFKPAKPWKQVGQPQLRAQFTWDADSVTAWAGLVPYTDRPPFVHFTTTDARDTLLYVKFQPADKVAWLPYHCPKREDLLLPGDSSDNNLTRAECKNLARVDQMQLKSEIKLLTS